MGEKKGEGQSGGVNIRGTVGSVGGDIVGRDKIVGAPPSADLDEAFRPLIEAIMAAPTEKRADAEVKLTALKQEAAKGKDANDSTMPSTRLSTRTSPLWPADSGKGACSTTRVRRRLYLPCSFPSTKPVTGPAMPPRIGVAKALAMALAAPGSSPTSPSTSLAIGSLHYSPGKKIGR
jgi:hypothetical protein